MKIGDGGAEALSGALAGLPALVRLVLFGNQIGNSGAGCLCTAALSCKTLKSIDLSDNRISLLPLQFQTAPHSIEVELEGNAMESPPGAVVARGQAALAAYWSDLRASHAPLDRIRLVLLGNGGAGKTTFARALATESKLLREIPLSLKKLQDWSAEDLHAYLIKRSVAAVAAGKLLDMRVSGDAVHSIGSGSVTAFVARYGVAAEHQGRVAEELKLLIKNGYAATPAPEQTNVVLDCPGIGDHGKVHLQVVDFAGQAEYYMTNALFMSDLHAVYAVVARAATLDRAPIAAEYLHKYLTFWLRFLAAKLAPGSQALTVAMLTHIDCIAHPPHLDMKRLCRSIPDDKLKSCGCLAVNYDENAIEASLAKVSNSLRAIVTEYCKTVQVPTAYARLAGWVRECALKQTNNISSRAPVMPMSEFMAKLADAEVVPETKMDRQLAERALQYLHGIGAIFIDSHLNFVVLDPITWLAKLLALFVREKDMAPIRSECGIVKLDDVLLHVPVRTEALTLLSIMSQLELCYCLPTDPEKYLLPCTLSPLSDVDAVRLWPPLDTKTAEVCIGKAIRSTGAH